MCYISGFRKWDAVEQDTFEKFGEACIKPYRAAIRSRECKKLIGAYVERKAFSRADVSWTVEPDQFKFTIIREQHQAIGGEIVPDLLGLTDLVEIVAYRLCLHNAAFGQDALRPRGHIRSDIFSLFEKAEIRVTGFSAVGELRDAKDAWL